MGLNVSIINNYRLRLYRVVFIVTTNMIRKTIKSIKAIASEVFKSLNNLNPNFMNKMFQVKDITYDLEDSNILC